MSSLQTYIFKGHDVRTLLADNDPWWVAKDVCEVLGIKDCSDAVEALDPDEKGKDKIPTPGGQQDVLIVNESGLYTLIIRSNKPEAKEFRRWITHDVLPGIRKTGTYSVKAKTQAELLLESAQMLVAQERRLTEMDDRLENIQATVTQIKGVQEAATKELTLIPLAQDTSRQRTTRSFVVELVRSYCLRKNLDYQTVWIKLYREFKYRYQFDARARAKNSQSGQKPLDLIEQANLMDDLYKLASEILADTSLN